MLYNNIKEKIYTAEGSLEGAFFRIAWPPSSDLISKRALRKGCELLEQGSPSGLPFVVFVWKVGKFELFFGKLVRKLNFYFENSNIIAYFAFRKLNP